MHAETYKIESLFKQNPRSLSAHGRSSSEAHARRLTALNELGAIINDCAYYELEPSQLEPTPQTEPDAPDRTVFNLKKRVSAMAAKEVAKVMKNREHTSQRSVSHVETFACASPEPALARKNKGRSTEWAFDKREEGWSYWKCKQVLQESSSGLRFGSTRGCVQKVRGSEARSPRSPRSPKKRASSPVAATKTFSRRKASVRPATAMGFRHELNETPLECQFQPLGRTHSTLETHTVFNEKKEDDEAYLDLVHNLNQDKKVKVTMMRVAMAWKRQIEFRAVAVWSRRKKEYRAKFTRLCKEPYRSKIMPTLDAWYFGPIRRKITRWFANLLLHKEALEIAAIESRKEAFKEIRKFTKAFVQAIDEDDDGGLSLCELKSAEKGLTGKADPMFSKAAIWLMADRNFQRYDDGGNGVLSRSDLESAMKVFLQDYWKYDGVLW